MLGIAITVVSIVVQLAATRYTPRIAEMFFRDKKNLAIMGFFVVACINAVWISIVVTSDFVPRATVAMTTVVVTASLLLLIPYFAYVFAFLDPEKVIARIGQQVLDAVLARGAARRDRDDLDVRQASCVAGLEHLSDIAVNTPAQKDKIIATGAVTALREFAVKYLKEKSDLPAEWFALGLAHPRQPRLHRPGAGFAARARAQEGLGRVEGAAPLPQRLFRGARPPARAGPRGRHRDPLRRRGGAPARRPRGAGAGHPLLQHLPARALNRATCAPATTSSTSTACWPST